MSPGSVRPEPVRPERSSAERGATSRGAGGGASSSGASTADAFLLPDRKDRIDRVVEGRTRTLVVVLEAFCDPQNVNAVLRTCDAFGVQEVHVVEGPMKPYEKNKKISKNADKWLDVVRWRSSAECLDALRARGFRVYATHLDDGAVALADLAFEAPVALVFGNEHRGVSPEALARADRRFAIPMRGFVQSLNVSVAVAVTLARAIERREAERGRHGDLDAADAAALRDRFYLLAVKQRARIAKAEQAEARVLSGRASRRIRRG
jgi:tRNA (guanosine-2'-O-)-methyltransferase